MKRYHALDSLRATMMLLGIWLHAVVGYSRDGGWPYKDAHPTAIYNWTLALIHSFRMPVFFMMAGFFGALLWERGARRFLSNRLGRIAAPFALFWVVMYPVVLWGAAYAHTWSVSQATGYIVSGQFLERLHPLHMWFLEYLLILYGLAFCAVPLLSRLPESWRGAANRVYRAAVRSTWRPLIFALPSTATLMLMRGAFLEDPPGFVPVLRIVIAYIVPFSFGWVLYLNRDLLETFPRHAWRQLALALGLVAAWMIFMDPIQNRPEYWHWVKPLRAFAGSLLLWLIAFGVTGLFLRYFNEERPLGRYLADGSYWMYLMHMPVLMVFQIALAGVAWPAALKVWIVIALSVPVLVLSYDLLVRPTWVGKLLNGRRYERRFFVRRPAAEPVAVTY